MAIRGLFIRMRTSRETSILNPEKLVNLGIYVQNIYCIGWYTKGG